jgi:iron complex transport system substrate-binding protein
MAPRLAKHLWAYVRFSSRLAALSLLAGLASGWGWSPPPKGAPDQVVSPSPRPLRVVSLDYCADQFVLKLADRKNIVALSRDAQRDFSYLRKKAIGLPQVRATAEDVLALNPDLIVRSYGGGPQAQAFFERAGIRVHQIGWGDDFQAVRNNVKEAAAAMRQEVKGVEVIAQFDQRLAAVEKARNISTLYVTPGGVTTGSGSMIDLMLKAAGLTNFQDQAGWHPLPLERLVAQRPAMVAAATFGDKSGYGDYWSSARHPVLRDVLASVPVAQIEGATTTCAGWFAMDAVEDLAKAGRSLQATTLRDKGAQP